MSNTAPMSDEAFVKAKGTLCPFCTSNDIGPTGPLVPDEHGTAGQPITCNQCHRHWSDEYRLVGYHCL